MWLGVIFLLVGGFGSLSAGSVTATSIMALSLASALLLLDLSGKPRAVAAHARSRYPVLKIQRTSSRHAAKKSKIIPALKVTLTSATP